MKAHIFHRLIYPISSTTYATFGLYPVKFIPQVLVAVKRYARQGITNFKPLVGHATIRVVPKIYGYKNKLKGSKRYSRNKGGITIKTFCPFLKEKCKENECVMWRENGCVLVSFFEGFMWSPEEEPLPEEKVEESSMITEGEREVPDWLKEKTPEELAVEMLDFVKKEFPEDTIFNRHTAFRYFWKSRGIQEFLLPSEVRLKIEKAEFLAEKELIKEEISERKQRLQEEKNKLPSLVDQCVSWARDHDLKRVTHADVDTFLLEKDIELLDEVRRALYSMVNLKLKSKR